MTKQFRIVFDLEADNLVEESTKVHCLVAKDLDRGTFYSFYDDETIKPLYDKSFNLERLPEFFSKVTYVIGHNIIRYDLPMLKKFFGLEQSFEVIDTLLWSKVLYPDRPAHKSQPTVLLNDFTGKYERITAHSMAAWGYRLGHNKVEYYDWDKFDEGMLHRCTEDVILNEKIYVELLREAKLI